jgi:Colicin V production protein
MDGGRGVELFRSLSWVDLAIILVLAIGVFAGFTQGTIVYVLNSLALLVAFVLAAQLKGPIIDLLGFWTAFSPEGRELLIFVLLFIGFSVAAWFIIWASYRRTRLPVPKQIDEIGGAILGLLYVALFISLHLVVLDSFFRGGGEAGGWFGGYYEELNGSLVIGFFRDTIVPVAGFVMRPFVPDEIATLLM